ncbi:MAG: inorganic diphosphatase [Methylococcaceae bacterium]
MTLLKVGPGSNAPHEVNVVIEIPAYSDPVKYETDKETGTLFVDRFMGTAMQYPTNYGYVPQSLSEDGDPVDVLVLSPSPLLYGCVIRCRPIGLLRMSDESGHDAKILAVPVKKVTPYYEKIFSYQDLPEMELTRIAHFFQHYKDLEQGKWVEIDGWFDKSEAEQEILKSLGRFDEEKAERSTEQNRRLVDLSPA